MNPDGITLSSQYAPYCFLRYKNKCNSIRNINSTVVRNPFSAYQNQLHLKR